MVLFQVIESRSKSHEIKKTAVKRERVPAVNMEDSPPVSDSDVSIGCCFSMNMSREISNTDCSMNYKYTISE